jgi:hypothetical protein
VLDSTVVIVIYEQEVAIYKWTNIRTNKAGLIINLWEYSVKVEKKSDKIAVDINIQYLLNVKQ